MFLYISLFRYSRTTATITNGAYRRMVPPPPCPRYGSARKECGVCLRHGLALGTNSLINPKGGAKKCGPNGGRALDKGGGGYLDALTRGGCANRGKCQLNQAETTRKKVENGLQLWWAKSTNTVFFLTIFVSKTLSSFGGRERERERVCVCVKGWEGTSVRDALPGRRGGGPVD
jgi:hypothetical protein